MLVVAGKSEQGDVLHCLMGPESELIMSMEGYCIVDITDILKRMQGTGKMFLKFTRAQSELQTYNQCQALQLACEASHIRVRAPDEADMPVDVATVAHKCSGCGQTTTTMALGGKNLCVSCIEIELGLHKSVTSPKPT